MNHQMIIKSHPSIRQEAQPASCKFMALFVHYRLAPHPRHVGPEYLIRLSRSQPDTHEKVSSCGAIIILRVRLIRLHRKTGEGKWQGDQGGIHRSADEAQRESIYSTSTMTSQHVYKSGMRSEPTMSEYVPARNLQANKVCNLFGSIYRSWMICCGIAIEILDRCEVEMDGVWGELPCFCLKKGQAKTADRAGLCSRAANKIIEHADHLIGCSQGVQLLYPARTL